MSEERSGEQSEQDRIIADNVRLLETDLVKETPFGKLDEATDDAREGIVHGNIYPSHEGMSEDEELLELSIRYETRTGRITPVPSGDQFQPGEYSMLATISRRREGQGVSVIVLTEFGDGTEVRPVLPQRLDPKHKIYGRWAGRSVEWGQSVWSESAEGDQVLRKSIQLFNQKFGT